MHPEAGLDASPPPLERTDTALINEFPPPERPAAAEMPVPRERRFQGEHRGERQGENRGERRPQRGPRPDRPKRRDESLSSCLCSSHKQSYRDRSSQFACTISVCHSQY